MLSDRGIALCADGLFLVKGDPTKRADAVLLYYPSSSVPNFSFRGKTYVWNRQHPNQDFLRQHPEYFSGESTTKIALRSGQVADGFDPFLGYEQLSRRGPNDVVEETVLTLGGQLYVKPADIGVTASILIGCHNAKHSDIDLVIRGRQRFDSVRAMVDDFFEPLTEGQWQKYFERYDIAARYGMSFDDFHRTAARKKDRFMFLGRQVSIFNVPAEGRPFTEADSAGHVRITGTVVDDSQASFYPSVYRVNAGDVEEVVSLGREHYLELFAGDRFECEGMLQRTPEGSRVLVDYIGDDMHQHGFLKLM